MAARKRFSSLPSLAEMSPDKKYRDVTKDAGFLWSTSKISTGRKKFWAIARYIGWTESLTKTAQTSQQKLSYNIFSNNLIKSSNEENYESRVDKNLNLKLIRRSLLNAPDVSKRALSKKSKLSENSKKNGLVSPAKKTPSHGKTLSFRECESVMFLEEIITLDDEPVNLPDKKRTEADQTMQRSEKMVSEVDDKKYLNGKWEYEEYLRLKLKYEGQMNNQTKEAPK